MQSPHPAPRPASLAARLADRSSRASLTLRSSRAVSLAALLAACSGGAANDEGDGPASQVTTSDGSTALDGSTTTGEPTTTDAASSGSSSADASSSTGERPPPECGALDVCGVECVDFTVDPGNCGKCGVACVIPRATAACVAGSCAVGSCDPGWVDCDADVENGCENPADAVCVPACKQGAPELCNLLDDNCDAQCDEGGVAGCRQPVHRASSPTLGHFYTLDLAEASSGDFKLEFQNYYHLYTQQLPGLVPFHRCLKGDGRRFYTTSATCEGAGPVEGVLGFIGTEAACGAVPLYRLYGNGDHFYTVSDAERDTAIAMYGYLFEGQVGFVWPGP
jgi:hypothetical protein